jgi:LysM repeat protein
MVYVVRSGDTLDSIAARFNVSLARLEAANPGLDPNGLLLVGTRLNMPPPAEHSPSAEHSPAP